MKKRLMIIAIIISLTVVTSTFTISAQQTKTANESNLDPYVMIEGEITGIIFDIHAYYILDGVDNDFHQESWECTITEESGINCLVPTPEDERDHYRLTGQLEGYKTNSVNVYVRPGKDWVWVHVVLTPTIKSKTANPIGMQLLNLFPMLQKLINFRAM